MLLNYPKDIGNKMLCLKSLTKCQNTKKALGNTLAVGVSELVLCATIEWE